MDTGRGSGVNPRLAFRLAPAMLAGLFVVVWVGCMSPRPPGRGSDAEYFPGEAGRFDPSAALRRWDDLREPSIRFSHHRQWEVKAPERVAAEFTRRLSADAPGRGHLRIAHAHPQDRIQVRPVPPLLIPEPFDTVEIGIEARASGIEPDEQSGPAAGARLWVKDRNGKRMPIDLGDVPYSRILRQRHLGADFLRTGAFPFHLVEIEVFGMRDADVELFFDDIVFYPQCRIPLPSRYTADERGWPRRTARIREQMMSAVPIRESDAQRHQVWRNGDGFTLAATGAAGRVEYRIAPGEDRRIVVDFSWNGVPAGRWPGVQIDRGNGGGVDETPRLYRLDDQSVGWMPGGNLRAEAWLDGGALRIRYTGGREVRRLILAPPDRPYRRLYLPFLNDGPDGGPAVFGDGRLAVAVYPDPMVSRASRLRFAVAGDPEGEAAARAEYRPASDGRRAWFEEQVVLDVSAELFDVLPAPPSWRATKSDPRLESVPWLDREWADEDTLRRLGAFGMSDWTIPDVWPNGTCVLFSDDEIRPGDPAWTRDALLRDPSGHWVEGAAAGTYRMKMDALRSRARVQRAASPPLSRLLLPVPLSARPPWALADYDARAYGAACFRPGVEALAGLLEDAADIDGPQWVGEDDASWWYAALLDAWQVSGDRGRRLWSGPLLPVVSQVSLRPHGTGIGIGRVAPEEADAPGAWAGAALDRYLALHLAYGLSLRMPPPQLGMDVLSRLYHPARLVQTARAGQPVVDMAYETDGRLEPLIRSLSSGSPRALERLYMRYANGLEVWVNGSWREDWSVRAGGEQWVLPPSGWVVSGAGVLAFVARGAEGSRVAGARAGHVEFWDGDGRDGTLAGLGGAGQILAGISESAVGEITVLDINGTGALRVAPALFGLQPPFVVEAHDPETGEAMDAAWEDMPDGFIHIRGPARPLLYRISMR